VSTRATGFPPNKNTANIYCAGSFRVKNTATGLSLLTQIHTDRAGALLQFQERRLLLYPAESDEILAFTDIR
jgi:hypothetical protein